MYIHELKNWPGFTWDDAALLPILSEVRNLQGRLIGRMEALGFTLREEAMLDTLTLDAVKTSKIEGENLDLGQVRSSVARQLGMDIPGMVPASRHVDGLVEMMMDATQQYDAPLGKKRLCAWQAALFPTGRSGMHKIITGNWRKDLKGPMQVVSGAIGKEKIHFRAPSAKLVPAEMRTFLEWFNSDMNMEPVIKSGIAHLWFVTVHPFEDGNGRIARTIADLQLARADRTSRRYYSVSAEIERQKRGYYAILEKTQQGNLNITGWLAWYLECLTGALKATDQVLNKVLTKAQFWEQHAAVLLNKRQQLMLNKLLDDFYGKLTTSKWAKMAKCSQDTALRDIQDLVEKGVLKKEEGGGRSTGYGIV